jgi:hypothetical protein
MRYLSERHLGFDAQELGFPSIRGCQAIVYVTDTGLYGFHNFGGAAPDDWKDRGDAFGTFVNGMPRVGAGKAVYGVCFATSQRGYGTANVRQSWLSELAAFASAVRFTGAIYGYDLDRSAVGPPALVEFSRTPNHTCVIQIKAWNKTGATEKQVANLAEHKTTYRPNTATPTSVRDLTATVIDTMPAGGYTTVYPEQLR